MIFHANTMHFAQSDAPSLVWRFLKSRQDFPSDSTVKCMQSKNTHLFLYIMEDIHKYFTSIALRSFVIEIRTKQETVDAFHISLASLRKLQSQQTRRMQIILQEYTQQAQRGTNLMCLCCEQVILLHTWNFILSLSSNCSLYKSNNQL